MSQSLFFLTTALHVSGVTITHLQEHKTTVTTTSCNRYTVLLSAVIMEELKHFINLINSRNVKHIKIIKKFINTVNGLHQFQLFHDCSRQQYGVTVTRCSYSCFVLLKMGDSDVRNM